MWSKRRMAGRKKKEFHEYLSLDQSRTHISNEEYVQSPATAFLRYSVQAKDAVNNCIENFKKNNDGYLNKQGRASLQHILSAMLPALMGHFETFQRHLFSGVFELSPHLEKFNVHKFFKTLDKETSIQIDLINLSAYRGFNANVGIVIADNLQGWHYPEKVNKYFNAFDFKKQFYSNDDCKKLKVLWQLRHSIVHTGSSITLSDAQKIEKLIPFGGKPIIFEKNFILEVSRKLHPLIRDATKRIELAFQERLNQSATETDRKKIEQLFLVKSPTAVWLK